MRLKSKLTSCLVLGILMVTAIPALADGNLSLTGDVWAKYFYDISNGGPSGSTYVGNNGFDLYRADLKGNYKFNDTYNATLMFDGANRFITNGVTPTVSVANMVYVREAYVSANWWTGGHMSFGLQPGFYTSTVDGATHTRWLAQDLAFTGGFMNEENAGVSFNGTCWNNQIGYSVMAQNGTEGFGAPADNALAFDIGVDIMPFGGMEGAMSKLGLTVVDQVQQSAAGQIAGISTGGGGTPGTNALTAALHWTNAWVDGALEYAMMSYDSGANSSSAFGGNVNVKFMDDWTVFARYITGNDTFTGNNGGAHGYAPNLGMDGAISPSTAPGVLGYKSVLTVGPTYSLVKDKITTAILFTTAAANSNSGNDATTSISWNWGASF